MAKKKGGGSSYKSRPKAPTGLGGRAGPRPKLKQRFKTTTTTKKGPRPNTRATQVASPKARFMRPGTTARVGTNVGIPPGEVATPFTPHTNVSIPIGEVATRRSLPSSTKAPAPVPSRTTPRPTATKKGTTRKMSNVLQRRR